MTHRLATNYAKNYCNRTLIVKVIVENVVTWFFLGRGVLCNNVHKATGYAIGLLSIKITKATDVQLQQQFRE